MHEVLTQVWGFILQIQEFLTHSPGPLSEGFVQLIVQLIIMVIMMILSMALKPGPPPPPKPKQPNIPTVKSGVPVRVIFGTKRVSDPAVLWFGDGRVEPIYNGGGRTAGGKK